MTKYEVKNGSRLLRFEGEQIATSSSARPGSPRWIEFALFKTDKGSYVLTRVGVSHVYHSSVCPLVGRYGLHEASVDDLPPIAVPCEECDPDYSDPIIYPETYRHWTLVTDDPETVLEALYKPDTRSNTKYLTRVAERLLEDASRVDPDIDQAYRIQYL